MELKIGDYVTRSSYNNDTIFRIVDIKDEVILKGVDIRLFADAHINDLVKCDYINEDEDYIDKIDIKDEMDRSEFFYLPAKILHIDGDKEYLSRCMNFYKKANVYAVGEYVSENDMPNSVTKYLKKYKPDILIITGHDSINKNKDYKVLDNYKNSKNFVKSVFQARNYEHSHDKLVIIAGACQSDYESLIKAGANFASSPKRINIHALDPAIIAVNLALTERNKEIDLINLLDKTKYGKDGIGGLKSNGMMFVGYPR
ncbi:MAG: sporulation peptidase YabG [Bacilli bacterium]|nr:sporulation peptidase YabG [Bacilli bacterium]